MRGAALILASLVGFAAQASEFTSLKGHGGPIMGLSVSLSGQVASASFDNSVGIWTDREARWLEGHDASVVDVEFVDGGRLLSGGDDFAVWLWQDGEGQLLGRHKGKVTDLSVSPDLNLAASASWDGTVMLWDLQSQAQSSLGQHSAGFSDVAFSADGLRLYAATSDGDIMIFQLDTEDPPRRLVRHGFGINEIVLGPDDSWLAYGAVDGVTRVIDPATGDEMRDFTLERRPILAMDFSPGTGQIAVGDGHGYIMIIDTAKWEITRDFKAVREGPIWALAFSPDGQRIWAGGIEDSVFGWPVALLDEFEPVGTSQRSFLQAAGTMSNGERQFKRKCSICHSLAEHGGRKAGPSLRGVIGRRAGTLEGYRYSQVLSESDIVWNDETIDALFAEGPDHFIPNSKMPMQRIKGEDDRRDLIAYIKVNSN